MDFAFFEQLTDEEAWSFLEKYRATGEDGFDDLGKAVVEAGGDRLDFSLASVRPAFEAVARGVATVPAELDESLPDWIKDSETYRSGLYDFSDDARVLIVLLSFYFAEVLVRTSSGALKWSVGDQDTAVQSQPVIEGFKNSLQMSPLLVTENLLRRLIEEPDPAVGGEVDRAISTWQGFVDDRVR